MKYSLIWFKWWEIALILIYHSWANKIYFVNHLWSSENKEA